MPHLSIEYSPTLEGRVDMRAFCRAMHEVLLGQPIFPVAGIRVRAHKADIAIVADGDPANDFVAMTLSLGAGRDKEQLRAAGSTLFAAGQRFLADPLATPHFAFSLEIRLIDPGLSWKDTPIHARLASQTRGTS